jgi:hypothetical protein
MTRKLLMVAAVALVALTSSISIGTAQAHRAHWGCHGWDYPGSGYPGWGYHARWPRYYGYYSTPYIAPACYVTVYGTTACY